MFDHFGRSVIYFYNKNLNFDQFFTIEVTIHTEAHFAAGSLGSKDCN